MLDREALLACFLSPKKKWLLSDAFPQDPGRLESLQRTASAHADDCALAPRSLKDVLPIAAQAFRRIEEVAYGNLNYRMSHRGHLSSDDHDLHNVPDFSQMQTGRRAKDLGNPAWAEGAQHRWTDPSHRISCAIIQATSPSFVRRPASLKITALSVFDSVAELDKTLSWRRTAVSRG